MGLYGIDFYGTDYYGPNPQFLPSTYSVYPFTYEPIITHPIGSNSALVLQWSKPKLLYPAVPQGTPQQATPGLKDSPSARVRLLRNALNLPSDENDGVQLFDLPLQYSPVQWQDNNIPEGFVYYTVFVYDGTQWQRGGDLVALMPGEYNYSPRLWELTPQVFKTWDDYLADPTNLTNPQAQMGPLQRFYNLVGAQFDFIRSEIDSLLTVNNPMTCSGGLLPLLSQELGLSYEPQMGMVQSRKMADSAVHIYKEKGTLNALNGIIGAAIGYGSKVATGYNMILDQNDSSFAQSTGHWSLYSWTMSNVPGTLTTQTFPVSGGPGNAPVVLTTGSPTTTALATLTENVTAGSAGAFAFQLGDWASPFTLLTKGVPLREGAITVSTLTGSAYVYPQNNHAFFVSFDFFDSSGNWISGSSAPTVTTPAGQWTRVWSTATSVPPNAVSAVTYVTSNDAFVTGEKVWMTAAQVEYNPTYGTNLTPNGDFENNVVTPWVAGTNAPTLSVTTSQANSGSHSMQLTATAAGAFSANANAGGTAGVPIYGNAQVLVSAAFRASTSGRTCLVGVDFYNSAGTFISSSYNLLNAVTDSTTGWATTTYSGTAPSTASFARGWVWVNDTGVVIGEIHYVDTFSLQVIGAPRVWESARDQRITLLPQRTNLVTNPSFETSTAFWRSTSNSALTLSAVPGSVNRWPTLRARATPPVPPGQTYQIPMPIVENGDLILLNLTTRGNTNIQGPYGWKQAISAKTGSTEDDIQKITYYKFANNEPATYTWYGSNVSPATVSILGYYNVDPLAPVTAQGPGYATGTGTTVNVPSENVPAGMSTGQQVVFISCKPNATIFPLGALKQETTSSSPGNFSSSSNDQQFTGGTTIGASSATLSQSALWLEQTLLIKGSLLPAAAPTVFPQLSQSALQVTSGSAGLMSVTSDPFPVTQGLYYAGSGYVSGLSVSQPAQMFIDWFDQNGATLGTTTSRIVQETTLGSTWVRLGVVAPAPTFAVAAALTFQWNATFTGGEAHFLDAVLFEQAPSVRSYFDGSTPLNQAPFAPPNSADYLWVGTQYLSPSMYYPRRTQKNYRITQLLPSYLPAGATFTLLYAQPDPANEFPGFPTVFGTGLLPHSIPFVPSR